jgi:hypothetical protein
MWKFINKLFFTSYEKEWRIEGPADTNMTLMREFAKQSSFNIFLDEKSQFGFVCRIWNLPSILNLGNFAKIACKLKQVTPHRCYLTVKFEGMRFTYLTQWIQRYKVSRFFKDKLFVIDNSTAS